MESRIIVYNSWVPLHLSILIFQLCGPGSKLKTIAIMYFVKIFVIASNEKRKENCFTFPILTKQKLPLCFLHFIQISPWIFLIALFLSCFIFTLFLDFNIDIIVFFLEHAAPRQGNPILFQFPGAQGRYGGPGPLPSESLWRHAVSRRRRPPAVRHLGFSDAFFICNFLQTEFESVVERHAPPSVLKNSGGHGDRSGARRDTVAWRWERISAFRISSIR